MQRRARPGLGTLVEIRIEGVAEQEVAALFAAAFECVESLEAQLSAHRPDSDLNGVCAQAHLSPQPMSAAVRDVLTAAIDLHRDSEGIFDVTRVAPSDPDQHRASSADIELLDDGRVLFRRPLRIDLGGIAKGYVIDRVVEVLQALGARAGCVNAGGDLRVFGDATEPVALRFADGFRTVAQLRSGAFAASRPGPRPMSIDDGHHGDRHYDGRDRQAVATRETIAVFAPKAMFADALTKVALVSAETMDRLCPRYSAEWRHYPFTLDPGP